MRFVLDEHGVSVKDAEVEYFVNEAIKRDINMHVANVLVMECLRANLADMPVETRPSVEWIVYGKQVHFNDYLAGEEAWKDARTRLSIRYSETVIRSAMKLRRQRKLP